RSSNPARSHGVRFRLVAGLVAALAAPAARADDTLTLPVSAKARRPVALPSGEKIELSLKQTIELTLQNVLDLDVASYNLEESKFGIQSAKGAFDPYVQLDLGATSTENATASRLQSSQTKSEIGNFTFGGLLPLGTTYALGWTNRRLDQAIPGFTTINPTYASGLSAGFTQPLLRNFGTAANERFVVQARLSRDSSAFDFVRAVQSAIQLSENAYWDLVYAVENLRAKQEALDRAKDLNRITKIKIDVGALAPIDIVQTEVTIAQREQDIITAEGLIGDAQDRLRRLLNVQSQPDWNRPIVPTDRPTRESLREGFQADVEAGFKRALETRPEVKQALLTIESKKVTRAYTRNQLRPRLDLSGSYGFNGLGAQALIQNPDGTLTQLNYGDALQDIVHRTYPAWTLGVTFVVPIGNNVARGNDAIASADLELARTNFAITKANLQVEVRAAARAIDTAYRSVAAATKARELAERNLDAEKKKYENGMTTSFQVAQIQNDLTTAITGELQAIATYLKDISAWHKSVGDILDVNKVVLEGLAVSTAASPAEEGAQR
ncbi:MAG TPA: TolC family protein, partial [Thermoanaerobaculia bacterium]|nr:TolC family protein [Thermoanaerobaculia bacterium]